GRILERYRNPVLFYLLSTLIPWVMWFVVGYGSLIASRRYFYLIIIGNLGIVGLLIPVILAFILIYSHPILRRDLQVRLFNLKEITPFYAMVTCFVMLASILLAQAISLLFGYSITQFSFSEDFSFTGGVFSAWFLLLIAPILEELAWHSYGTDSLRRRFTLFTTS